MNEISLELRGGTTAFTPGQEVAGSVRWRLDPRPESIEVRLFWRTQGKGTEDSEIVEVERLGVSSESGEQEFRLRLPDGPYSFSGKLISLLWAIEAVALPSQQAFHQEITMSPTGREVLLFGVDEMDGMDETAVAS